MRTDELILRASQNPEFVQRFWAKARRGDGCWDWTAACTRNGYGKDSVPTGYRPNRTVAAHRVAWIVINQRTTDGLHVLHTCDNCRCVNPDHLFLGTIADNAHDRSLKGRSCQGSRHPSAKLSEEQVRQIRALRGLVAPSAIARQFGMSVSSIRFIHSGHTWASVK